MKITSLPITRETTGFYPVRHGNFSFWLYKRMPPAFDVTAGGLSTQDWSTRLMLLSLYAPQIYLAIKYRQHPVEVIGRNATIWLSQLLFILLQRSPEYGFNNWVNTFMHPKQKVLKTKIGFMAGFRNRLAAWINHGRIESNYLEFLQKAGVKLHTRNPDISKAVKEEAVWAHLKANEMNTLLVYCEKLKKQLPQLQGAAKRLQEKEIRDLTRFINRFSYLGGATFAIANTLIALVVGVWANKFIFKFFVPFDKKYKPRIDLKKPEHIR